MNGFLKIQVSESSRFRPHRVRLKVLKCFEVIFPNAKNRPDEFGLAYTRLADANELDRYCRILPQDGHFFVDFGRTESRCIEHLSNEFFVHSPSSHLSCHALHHVLGRLLVTKSVVAWTLQFTCQ